MANATLGEIAPAIHSKPSNAYQLPAKTPESPPSVPSEQAGGDHFLTEWGFDLNTLYRMAKQFFCQNEGKAFHITYEDKLRLIAYTQQEKHGPYDESKCKPVGYLDLIGQDRREAWMDLEDMDKVMAKQEFVALLHDRCPLFRPFVFAHKASLQAKDEAEQKANESASGGESPSSQSSSSSPSHLIQNEAAIRSVLNQQTIHQFSQYAAQQSPDDAERQQTIVRQLQEEHFKQYMRQLTEQTSALSLNGHPEQRGTSTTLTTNSVELPNGDCDRFHEHHNHDESGHLLRGNDGDSDDEEEEGSQISVTEPTMWTRKDIVEFKDAIRREGADCIIKVGHGETVTVRVPTHDDGQCLYWEFATDHYDIGFGVYFEWTKNPGSTVSVHISDSEEESNEEEDETGNTDDIEAVKVPKLDDGPPTSVIIPIYRRDSHQEVYVGRHQYPGQGIYLLKFDNSFSLWRGKTLYYRVYYAR